MQATAKDAPIKVHVRKPKGMKVNVSIKILAAKKAGQAILESVRS